MDIIRVGLLIIHIIAAGLWLSEEAIGIIFKRLIKANQGKPAELTLAQTAMTLFGTFGPLASMGILLTGIGMTLHSGWALLGIGAFTPGWLVLKQIIYLGLIAYVMLVLLPRSNRIAALFEASTASGILSDEGREHLHRFWMIGMVHTLIVLVNVFLAVWKPTIGG